MLDGRLDEWTDWAFSLHDKQKVSCPRESTKTYQIPSVTSCDVTMPFLFLLPNCFYFSAIHWWKPTGKVGTVRSSMFSWPLWKRTGIPLSVNAWMHLKPDAHHSVGVRSEDTNKRWDWLRLSLFDVAALWGRMPLKIDSVDGSLSPSGQLLLLLSYWETSERRSQRINVGPNAPLFK